MGDFRGGAAPLFRIATRYSSRQRKRTWFCRRLLSSGSPPSRPPSVPVVEEVLPLPSNQKDISEALKVHHSKQNPVVLRGAVAKNDAIHFWKSLDYLRLAVGEDVPCEVEIGGTYSDPTVEKPSIRFGDYIQYMEAFEERYGAEGNSAMQPKKDELVYLAQNEVFTGLSNDFEIPTLCTDRSYGIGDGKLYSSMIWFGPRGCVSPLHYDPLDNLLMQFVGEKKVLLFPKSEGADKRQEVGWYYAGSNGMQYNTSAVDVEQPDMERYPLFAHAPPAIQGHLRPGDVLFIPHKWWHHVRTLETSVSVNVWWR